MNELLDELLECLSSLEVDDLLFNIRNNNIKKAKKIIKEQKFNNEDATKIINHFQSLMNSKKMLIEIDDISSLAFDDVILVSYGGVISQTKVTYKSNIDINNNELYFFNIQDGYVLLSKATQLWKII